jgi:cell division protein FtsW
MSENDSYIFGTPSATVDNTAPAVENPINTPRKEPNPAPEKTESAIQYRRHGDKSIWGIFIALCFISIIELYSASSREVAAAGVYGPILRHCVMLGLGATIVWALERMHYKYFYGLAWIIAGMSVATMIYVLFCGEIVNGARRSVSLMGFTIQPSEFIKMSAVLVIAKVMSQSQRPKGMGVKTSGVVKSAIAVLVFGGVLFSQGLTNTILLMSISVSMMLIGGIEWKKLFCVLGIYAIIGGGMVAYKVMHDSKDDDTSKSLVTQVDDESEKRAERHGTWQARLGRFFSSTPKYEEEITASNRQEMYSYMAQANGGLIGVFPGNSRETARLPLAFSDYIYAIIIEDTGFLGGLTLMIIYLWLLSRAGVIARRCHRAFPVLLVMGMAVMIVLQALFHMAITTGTFPVSGQPLPLISKGGTSILVTSIAFGAMLSVSRTAVQNGTKKEDKEELSSLPEELRANNPVQI